MHIDSYQFGRIVIDGKSYDSDVIILADKVCSNWWRKEGHSLAPEDLQALIAAKPHVLVIGCGASGLMKVPEKTQQHLEQNGIEFESFDTYKAVEHFNELAEMDSNVAAALHLTC